MIVLGIDSALSKTGFALVQKNARGRPKLIRSGLIKTNSKDDIQTRLMAIYDELIGLADEQLLIDVIVVENVMFVAAGADAAIKLGAARGVVYLLAAQMGWPMFLYPPATVKKVVAGHGRAGKDDVQRVVRDVLLLKSTQQEDEADATAVALCYLAKEQGFVLRSD